MSNIVVAAISKFAYNTNNSKQQTLDLFYLKIVASIDLSLLRANFIIIVFENTLLDASDVTEGCRQGSAK